MMHKPKLLNASKRRSSRVLSKNLIKYVKNSIAFFVLGLMTILIFPNNFTADVEDYIYNVMLKMDIKLSRIEVHGIDRIPHERILKISGLEIGRNLLSIDLAEVISKLQKESWVAKVSVSRFYPDKIIINITEEKPAAIFIKNNQKWLINKNGKFVEELLSDAETQGYIIVKGEGGNALYNQLLEELYVNHDIYNHISELERVSERRWNVTLDTGLMIKLPETGIADALRAYSHLIKENNANFISAVDLRLIPDRIYLRML